MLFNQHVDQYIRKWKSGELILNEKRIQLLKLIEKEILPRDDIYYFDEEQINNYIEFSQAWYFELDEWEKFISAFIFLFYKEDDEVVLMNLLLIWGVAGVKMALFQHWQIILSVRFTGLITMMFQL